MNMIKSRMMSRTGHVARMGKIRNAQNNLFRKTEGKILRIRSRRRWEDNIRLDLKEIRWESVAWIHLVQDRD
jgi:hypothetical protein